jgi:hypothetical protein
LGQLLPWADEGVVGGEKVGKTASQYGSVKMTSLITTISWYKQSKLWLHLLQLTPFFWIVAWFLFHIVLFPWYWHELGNVEAEFKKITPPIQAHLIEYRSQSISDRASVTAKYTTELDYAAMREYYDKIFANNDWSYRGEDRTEINYCKGNYTASLYRYKEFPGSDYTLAIDVGVTSNCEMRKGGDIAYIPFYDLLFLFGCSATFLMPYAVIMGWASFIMNKQAYQQFRGELISKPQSIGDARLWAVISLLIGVLGFLISTYKIAMYLINW